MNSSRVCRRFLKIKVKGDLRKTNEIPFGISSTSPESHGMTSVLEDPVQSPVCTEVDNEDVKVMVLDERVACGSLQDIPRVSPIITARLCNYTDAVTSWMDGSDGRDSHLHITLHLKIDVCLQIWLLVHSSCCPQ